MYQHVLHSIASESRYFIIPVSKVERYVFLKVLCLKLLKVLVLTTQDVFSGSALANRLSEIADWKVLLLEAGRQESIFSRTPGIAPALQKGSDYDWNYTTTDQKITCQGKKNLMVFDSPKD